MSYTFADAPPNKELTKVTTEIKQLQKTIIIDKQNQMSLEQELQTIETMIGKLNQQTRLLNAAILKEQLQLTKLQNSHTLATNHLTTQQNALTQQIRAIYQLNQLHPLKIILNETDPNTIQRHLVYYRHLTASRMQLIFSIQTSVASLQKQMNDITQHQNNLKKLLSQKQLQQRHVKLAQQRRQQLVNKFKQSVTSKEQQLATLVENQKALFEIISTLRVNTENPVTSLPFNQQRGKLHWPVLGNIAANFGSSLDVAGQHLSGVIIKATQGTSVHAVFPGKVIFANWLRGFGLLIIISHDNNYMTLYGRNQTLLTQVGSHVRMGDVIATTGNTGGFIKSGLYFEIRKNGLPVDPNIWCR